MHLFKTKKNQDGGVAIVEYALIVGVVALLSVSAVTLVGERTEASFTDVAEAIDTGSSSDSGGSVDAPGGESGGESDDQGSDDQDDQNQDDQGPGNQDDQDQDDQDDQNQDDEDQDDESDEDASDDEEQDNSDDEDSGDSGDENSGQDEGTEDEDEEEDEEDPTRPNPIVTDTDADFTWWNNTKHGGNGDWRASSEFRNDTNRHQYLKLEVTKVDEKGRTTTTTVNSFYVPANGKSTFSQWSNSLSLHNGKVTGVTEVQIKVISVTTSDQNWQPYTYEVDARPISIDPPSIP